MTTFDAILVGLIQGLTEFIPVSSSGHLAVARFFVPIANIDLSYIALLHLGTVLAVVAALYDDIWKLLRDFCKGERYALQFALLILISMVPAAIVGVLFEDALDALFCEKGLVLGKIPLEPYRLVGLAFLGCACWVLGPANAILKERNRPREEGTAAAEKDGEALKTIYQMDWKDALVIGLAQALAVIPGLSRSGTTIYAGLCRSLTGEAAARFSFLMSLPIIMGAVCKDFLSPDFRAQFSASMHAGGLGWTALLGVAVAAVSGYVAIRFLIRLVNKYDFQPFIAYLWVIGLLCIAS